MRRQHGRKPLPENVRRSDFFRFRLSALERAKLDEAAGRVGIPLSEFVRTAAIRQARDVETVATAITATGDRRRVSS
ncbi:MAG: hypothetical protein ACE5KM_13925 [Planctomycetaceae bacterium]